MRMSIPNTRARAFRRARSFSCALVLLIAACGNDAGDPSPATTAGQSGGGAAGAAAVTAGSGGQSAVAGVSGGGASGSGVAGAAISAGTAGASAGSGGSSDGGSGGATAGSGGSAGMPMVAAMCQSASGAVPTFKKVAASDKSIPGAVGLLGNPEDASTLYVPQHFTGDVRILQNGKLLDAKLLHVDVRQDPPGREQGLLSIALSPKFSENHRMFVYYSAPDPVGQSTIAEYELETAISAKFVRNVYTQAHSHQWHNGGNLQFGKDGWLYFSVGDNQADCGPKCAQDAEGPYGRIKKLDVAQADPESTVKTFNNGLRNPWRWSFDPLTFDVLVGDVGDGGDTSEKLFFAKAEQSAGKNWGWAPGTLDNRKPEGTIDALKSDGGAIIGGVIYRGSNPKMAGACGLIFYGHLKGQVYTIKNDGSDKKTQSPLSGTNDLGSFGVDARGEIYLTYLGGQVYRIDAE
jgi:hypothetical protein